MTVLEQHYMETVPRYLKEIAQELKKLNENLKKDGEDNPSTPAREAQ